MDVYVTVNSDGFYKPLRRVRAYLHDDYTRIRVIYFAMSFVAHRPHSHSSLQGSTGAVVSQSQKPQEGDLNAFRQVDEQKASKA